MPCEAAEQFGVFRQAAHLNLEEGKAILERGELLKELFFRQFLFPEIASVFVGSIGKTLHDAAPLGWGRPSRRHWLRSSRDTSGIDGFRHLNSDTRPLAGGACRTVAKAAFGDQRLAADHHSSSVFAFDRHARAVSGSHSTTKAGLRATGRDML